MNDLSQSYASYFGAESGGVDLLASLCALPLAKMDALKQAIADRGPASRLFFMGNGGSFDNARLMAQLCRTESIMARTPGARDDYFLTTETQGYEYIYQVGLRQDRVGADDIVIGISGSGNSQNVLRALRYAAEQGAEIYCFGGRDGGEMKTVCGEDHSLIAINESMEAIEDLHMIMVLSILRALREKTLCQTSLEQLTAALTEFISDGNLQTLNTLGRGILASMENNARCMIIGSGIGANHFRADMGRGACNTIPIRGPACPELFTLNSAQATANDDGPDFILADGLVKFDCTDRDFAVLCTTGSPQQFHHCREVLSRSGTPRIELGGGGLDIRMFAPFDLEFAIAMVGHATGDAIRRHLQRFFQVRPLQCDFVCPPGQKKLGATETTDLEQKLRASGVIAEDESITFCYGKLFAVRWDGRFDWQRCYY